MAKAKQTNVEQLAEFVSKAVYKDLTDDARAQLKLRVLDSIGCAIGALGSEPTRLVREQVDEFGGTGPCTLIGGAQTSPDRAAFHNTALVRYLDFMDSYLGKKQSGHPSDNFGSVLAAAEYADASGKDFLLALAIAYAIECKLLDMLPVEQKAFDHTVQLAYSMSAGVSKALGLDANKTAQALAMSGTAFQGLVTSRSGHLSNWKGLASSMVALGATNTAFLARRGITGPVDVLEGKNGLMEAVGEKPKLEWSSADLDLVLRTDIKKYNSEVHTQSIVEGVLDLRSMHTFTADEIDNIEVETFIQAYNIVGQGDEAGDKFDVHTKEQADHSIPYIVAATILDGKLTPEQYVQERIEREDVQELLKKVKPRTQMQIGKKAFAVLDTFTARYPEELPAKITIALKDGRELIHEKSDYRGFFTNPMSAEEVRDKFASLAKLAIPPQLGSQIEDAVENLENIQVRELTALLGRVKAPSSDDDSKS